MNKAPLLAIRCLTYNHEHYIRQCLEGFIIQKTTFPFIAIVHDDASTDKTAEIIEEYALKYPDIIKPILEKENQYSKHDGSLGRILNNAIPESVKYIAMCEGDDYWTDPLKLQKQVNILESNPEYGLIHTNFKIVNEANISEYRLNQGSLNDKNCLESLLLGNHDIGTLTTVYRKKTYESLPHYYRTQRFLMGDLPLWLEFAKFSKVAFIPDITASYRRLENSASHSSDFNKRIMFLDSTLNCRLFYSDKFNMNYLNNKIIKRYELTKLKLLAIEGSRTDTIKQFITLLKKYNLHLPLKTYAFLCFAIFPITYKISYKILDKI